MSEAQRRYIGKVVIVTGGAMGMGQATAIAFGREGASVIVADIDDAAGAETVQAIEAAGGHGRYV
ncbi:MAG: SDR family NAD(P)-dependent oxidoreductase, partial [Proteobacteria bacterium]|nr:SDR family NAD(P)-dependent oxidoreductase [Pseudomonadota bacterium]